MPLSAIQVKELKPAVKDRKIFDGGGLYLHLKKDGKKYWRLQYRFAGKQRIYSIGVYPQVSLKEARDIRYDVKKLLLTGVDPNHDKRERKRQSNVPLFKELAYMWWNHNKESWTDAHAARVIKRLGDNCFTSLGKLPVDKVRPNQIIDVIKVIEERGALDVASRVNQAIRAMYRYAIQRGLVTYSPAGDLDGIVKKKKVKHRASLPKNELPKFLKDLELYSERGAMTTQIAIQLLVLWFVRPGELRKARWKDFDFADRVWRVPAETMKMDVEHIVPLSTQAIALLKKLQDITGNSELLFPSTKNKTIPISDNTMRQAIFRLGYDGNTQGKSKAVPHGFRNTASSILNEEGYTPDAIERQLAHRERNNVRAAYTHHARYLKERKEMMQWWADYLDRLRN